MIIIVDIRNFKIYIIASFIGENETIDANNEQIHERLVVAMDDIVSGVNENSDKFSGIFQEYQKSLEEMVRK